MEFPKLFDTGATTARLAQQTGQVIMTSSSSSTSGFTQLFFARIFWGVLAATLALDSFAEAPTAPPESAKAALEAPKAPAEAVAKVPLEPTKAQSVTTMDILDKLSKRHYRNLPIDDKLSIEFLDNYLKTLDPARLYFLQADVDAFMKDKNQHDDYLKKGELKPGFQIYQVYQKRVVDRLEWVLAQLENPAVSFDFKSADAVEMDREKAPWPLNREEADDLWDKRLKLSVLNLKLAGKTVDEAKVTLQRRYKTSCTAPPNRIPRTFSKA
ncbi:MAG: hypothetical protein NVV73_08220 [Cellvibrionaceae bacterium]|nr:hypothetical protein [Cellvibrionaceae bacterium]